MSGSSYGSEQTYKIQEEFSSSKLEIDSSLLKQGKEDRISFSSSNASYLQSDKGFYGGQENAKSELRKEIVKVDSEKMSLKSGKAMSLK